jgi:hypothetical protein
MIREIKTQRPKIFLSSLLAGIIFAVGGCCGVGEALGAEHPFRPGETLTYEVRWEFIPAATAVLQVLPMETMDGAPAYHFGMTIKTNATIDKIYKVRDRIDAYTDDKMTRSLLYKKNQREGKHKRDITVTFDWKKSEARYTNFDKSRNPISIPPRTFDPLSVFYAFRLNKLEENKDLEANVTDGKKATEGKARILSRQKVKTAGGEFDTFLIEPDLKDIGGVFKKSEDAKLLLWVTADQKRIPVKIASEVAVGSFIAELTSIETN